MHVGGQVETRGGWANRGEASKDEQWVGEQGQEGGSNDEKWVGEQDRVSYKCNRVTNV